MSTDRVSAFDVVLKEPIPGKGKVLTTLSAFWFRLLSPICPNHLISVEPETWDDLPEENLETVRGRCMRVKRASPIPFEFVVRGYLTGSGWKEYKEKGSISGISLPPGLKHAEKLEEPILTPTTKAREGHDEPVTFEEMAKALGKEKAEKTRGIALELYKKAHAYALKRRIVIADTKMEFGEVDGELMVIDELFTPDSSRFWPAGEVGPGKTPTSYDKQVIRDWLTRSGWNKTPPPPSLPEEVILATAKRYEEICVRLTGLTPEGEPAFGRE